MNKAFKFRLYPNGDQRVLMAKTFGCVRFIYNHMLADKIAYYEDTKRRLMTTPAQYKEEFPWLKAVDSLALANAQLHLETAFRNFFNNESVGFPNFKSKHKGHNSYTTNLVNGNIALADGYLKLPKLGMVRVKQHRQIPGGYKLKSATVSITSSGKYFAALLYEYHLDIQESTPVDVVGLDYTMNGLYVDSNGSVPDYPRFYREAQAKLAREQRKLSRRKKGGVKLQEAAAQSRAPSRTRSQPKERLLAQAE